MTIENITIADSTMEEFLDRQEQMLKGWIVAINTALRDMSPKYGNRVQMHFLYGDGPTPDQAREKLLEARKEMEARLASIRPVRERYRQLNGALVFQSEEV
jgi:hypothetical protein